MPRKLTSDIGCGWGARPKALDISTYTTTRALLRFARLVRRKSVTAGARRGSEKSVLFEAKELRG